MLHDENRAMPAQDTEAEYIAEAVHRLILMRETGPKSAAWHRVRTQTLWRLQRALENAQARHRGSTTPQAEQGQPAEAQHDQPAEPVDPQ